MEEVCGDFTVKEISLSSKDFAGQAVLCDDYLFLVIWHQRGMPMAMAGALLGGAVGGLIGVFLDKKFTEKNNELDRVSFKSLPETIQKHSVWRKVKDNNEVIIVPKDAVTRIEFSWLSGVKVTTEKVTFKLPMGPFELRRVKELFKKYGWESLERC